MSEKKYHYVYRITEINTGMHYYGDRSCNCHPKMDIGKLYFSSFTNYLFQIDQKQNPERYKYKILKSFESKKGYKRLDAKELEIKLHKKFNVGLNKMFINKTIQTSTKFDRTGIAHSIETKSKISKGCIGKGMSGKTVPELRKQKISNTLKNNNYTDSIETRTKKSLSHIGLKHSKESKLKMSAAKKGIPKKQLLCPHCGKIGGTGNMQRWHFNNCKNKGEK